MSDGNRQLTSPAGYSGTPLARKLGFKIGFRVILVREPRGFREMLEGLPDNVIFVSDRNQGGLDLAIVFCANSGEFLHDFPPLKHGIRQNGMIWVAYPKKSSGVKSDLDFDLVQRTGLSLGLVDVKICAIDEVWTGLKFVIPVKDRT